MQNKAKRIAKIFTQVVFVVLVFYFLGSSLLYNWNRLDFDFSNLSYQYLVISLIFFGFAWVELALSWDYITHKLKKPLGSKKAIKIWVWSQTARYIPGSVWQVVGRVYMSEKEGLSKGETLASIAIETSNLVISSVVIFALSIPFWPRFADFSNYTYFLGAALLVFAFLHPKVFNFVTTFFIHKLGKNEKPAHYSFKEILKMFMPYLVAWLIFGIGFFFLTMSFKNAGALSLPISTGAFALSWVVGFLFIIAPGGLGAREVALVFFLSLLINNPLAIVLAILSRVMMIIAELLVLGVSAFF